LNFFRAKVGQQVNEKGNTSVIYAIEEPETSLYSWRLVIIKTKTPVQSRSIATSFSLNTIPLLG